jgi:DNA-binding HxlR family transcriptional regulator
VLERDGVVVRREHADDLARYELTALGATPHEPLRALRLWAEPHVEDVLAAQDRYDVAHPGI